jgi:hypothetical protein
MRFLTAYTANRGNWTQEANATASLNFVVLTWKQCCMSIAPNLFRLLAQNASHANMRVEFQQKKKATKWKGAAALLCASDRKGKGGTMCLRGWDSAFVLPTKVVMCVCACVCYKQRGGQRRRAQSVTSRREHYAKSKAPRQLPSHEQLHHTVATQASCKRKHIQCHNHRRTQTPGNEGATTSNQHKQ